MENFLKTRYTKILFRVKFSSATSLVREKTSALRGGMGEMLLRAHCIQDRKCEECGFESECLVQRMMYSKLEKRPVFLGSGDSVGYMIDCQNKQKEFKAGDTMEFTLTLFGRNIVYFSQYLNAFHALGYSGLGRNESKYEIIEVKNLFSESILQGSNIYMKQYKWQTVEEHVNARVSAFGEVKPEQSWMMQFTTPTQIKYRGVFQEDFTEEALKESLLRRLYILACFENQPVEDAYIPKTPFPKVLRTKTARHQTYRHSDRRSQTMRLQGITGKVWLGQMSEEWLKILLAGEVVNIGKTTSFGYGSYQISRLEGKNKETEVSHFLPAYGLYKR